MHLAIVLLLGIIGIVTWLSLLYVITTLRPQTHPDAHASRGVYGCENIYTEIRVIADSRNVENVFK